jgi:hypothetical protein
VRVRRVLRAMAGRGDSGEGYTGSTVVETLVCR